MIKANRIVLCSDILYDNVEVYKYGEQGGEYVPGLFEKYQLFLKNNVVKSTINMNHVSLVQIRREKPKAYMKRYKRLVVTYGQISFGPAWMIPEDRYEDLGIPFLFGYEYKSIEHCAFVANDWLYLTKDELVISLEH